MLDGAWYSGGQGHFGQKRCLARHTNVPSKSTEATRPQLPVICLHPDTGSTSASACPSHALQPLRMWVRLTPLSRGTRMQSGGHRRIWSCMRTVPLYPICEISNSACVGVGRYLRVCARMCVCVRTQGFHHVLPGLPVEPVWPRWRPRVGSLPIIAGLRCRPGVHPCVAPRPVQYALGPEPGSLPQDHPGSGVVAPWLPPGQLHGISSVSPSSPCCPVCCVCIGAFTAGGALCSETASMAYSIWRFPQKGCS